MDKTEETFDILMQIYCRKGGFDVVDYETQCLYSSFTNLQSAIDYCLQYVKENEILISY